MNLHRKIMNLALHLPSEYEDAAVRMAYRVGHRDARHAAAELANESDLLQQELLEALKSFIYEFGDKANSRTFQKAKAAIAKAEQQ